MIKLFLKHMFAEHAINTLFDRVGINFMSRTDRIRKLTVKRFRTMADFRNNKYNTIVMYEVGKHPVYTHDDGSGGFGAAVTDEIKIHPTMHAQWVVVDIYHDGILWDSREEILTTLEIEYY